MVVVLWIQRYLAELVRRINQYQLIKHICEKVRRPSKSDIDNDSRPIVEAIQLDLTFTCVLTRWAIGESCEPGSCVILQN